MGAVLSILGAIPLLLVPLVQAHELGYGKTFKEIQSKQLTSTPNQKPIDYTKLQAQLQQIIEHSKALSAKTSQYDALLEIGKQQLEQDNVDRALSAFSVAQHLIPVMADSYRWIAEALLKQGQYLHAEKFALHFVSMVSSEQSAEGWRLLGDIYRERGEADLMLASYRNLLMSTGQKPLQHWLLVTNALRSAKYYQESFDALNRGLNQYPANAELIKLKIQVLREQGNIAYAKLIAWHWLSMDSGSATAWHEIAKLQRANGADDLAQDSLKQASQPGDATISQSF
jgi:tetratricopeptide (TPR) repeat protein